MKNLLVAVLPAVLFLAACTAGVRVSHTEVATGAVNPRQIYIRPFSVAYTRYRNPDQGAAAPIRKSLAPAEFATDLQEELCKLAPAMVIRDDEFPRRGWLVEGQFELIDAGDSNLRSTTNGFSGAGQSHIKLHVKVIEVGGPNRLAEDAGKEALTVADPVRTAHGTVIYEFDLAGGSGDTGWAGSSGATGCAGTIEAPGGGDAVPFDFRNAAERVMLTLSPDPFRYGYRSSPTQNL